MVSIGVALFGVAYLIFRLAGAEVTHWARTEEGPAERATLVAYGLAIVLALLLAARKGWRLGWCVALVLFVALSRELDVDIRTGADGTVQKLSSIRYWRSANFPLLEKLVIGATLAALAVSGVVLLRRGLPTLMRDLRAGEAYTISVIGISVFFAISMLLDNRLDMGNLQSPVVMYFSLVEEFVELGIPLLACLALVRLWPTVGGDVGAAVVKPGSPG